MFTSLRRTMNALKNPTPLVQKLILVMLVLIFGCLVLVLLNGRKQIESLHEGPPVSTAAGKTQRRRCSPQRIPVDAQQANARGD